MALEDQLKNSRARASVGKGESDVSVMHDFIRKQAINQQADYSVSAFFLFPPFFCVFWSTVPSSKPSFNGFIDTLIKTQDILRSGRGKVKRQKDMDPPSS